MPTQVERQQTFYCSPPVEDPFFSPVPDAESGVLGKTCRHSNRDESEMFVRLAGYGGSVAHHQSTVIDVQAEDGGDVSQGIVWIVRRGHR